MVRIAAYAALRRVGLPKLLVLGVLAALALYAVGGARAETELSYTERTSNCSATSTTAAGADVCITSNSVVLDGTQRIRVEVFAPRMRTGASGTNFLTLWQDSTDLGTVLSAVGGSDGATIQFPGGVGARYLTPSAGTYTFYAKTYMTGTNSLTVCNSGGPGNFLPCYLRVVDTADATGGGGASDLADLEDVDLTGLADTDVLKWDASSSMWEPAADNEGAGGGGTVTLSTGDRDRLDLAWWGVWALVGLALLALIAPAMYRLLDVRHGMGGRFERG